MEITPWSLPQAFGRVQEGGEGVGRGGACWIPEIREYVGAIVGLCGVAWGLRKFRQDRILNLYMDKTSSFPLGDLQVW